MNDMKGPMKIYQWPEALTPWIEKHLQNWGYSLNQPRQLAQCILKASTDYQDRHSTTQWDRPEIQVAYLSYFFPLNYIRTLKVIDEGSTWNFWQNTAHFIDYGCGPGTMTQALIDQDATQFKTMTGVDNHSPLSNIYQDRQAPTSRLQFTSQVKPPTAPFLVGASYVLNELKEIPPWFFDAEKLAIIEPSTKQAFPQLLSLRDQLIAKGFQVIAPCPHTLSCPLQKSKRDWCHDRVHWNPPSWFQALENHLPIKNKTLSFSYLLATRKKLTLPSFKRVVGDALVEKGKTRWMICQGADREFLSHLKRQGKAPELYRGEKIQLKNYQKKGDEIRYETKDLTKLST